MTKEEIQIKIGILEKDIQTIRTGLVFSKMNFDDGQEFGREGQQKFANDQNTFLNEELKDKISQLDELNRLLNPRNFNNRRRFK